MKKANMKDWQIEDMKRLRALFDAYQARTGESQTAFGVAAGIGTQGMVNQYLVGKAPLNLQAAGKFAERMGVHIDDISPTLADTVRWLYPLCESQRNTDFGVDPGIRAYIQEQIRLEIERSK